MKYCAFSGLVSRFRKGRKVVRKRSSKMKRFNTDRIRQRMRKHNERFPNSKGKLFSFAPVQKSLPPQTGKENFDKAEANELLNGTSETKDEHPAQLSLCVTMSEDHGDDGNYPVGVAQNESNRVSDSEDSTVPSVWAMMENYQGTFKDSVGDESSHLDEPVMIIENDSDNSSYHSADSFGSNSISTEVQGEAVINSGMKQKVITHQNDHVINESGEIEISAWLEEEGGEIIQSSFYTQDASQTEINEELETPNRDVINHSIFRQDAESLTSDHAISPMVSSYAKCQNTFSQPTPARVRQEWIDAADDEEFSNNPDSLLQESMTQSIQMLSGDESHLIIDNASDSNVSFTSHAESKGDSESAVTASTSDATTQRITKPKLHIETGHRDDIHSGRLRELESNLRTQKSNTDQVQSRLKERVFELEQALKVTAATPRGTVINENPLKTLLNRNQTLVKEVRFADQTCVELSAKISELEMHNERLQEEVALLEQENDDIQSGVDEKEAIMSMKLSEKDAKIARLEEHLALANEKVRTKATEEENLRFVLSQAIGIEGLSETSQGLSSNSTIISDPNGSVEDSTIASKSFQQQIGMLVERAKSVTQAEEMKKEIHDLRSENISLKSELLLSQQQPADIATDSMDENLQIRKENDFLGRQLGVVQEKLDYTQTKLNDECIISESLRTQLTTLKHESERLLTESALNVDRISDSDNQQHIVSMVQETIMKLRRNYEHLECDVEETVAAISDRVDGLTATITHLRSSLLFEKESVSSMTSKGEVKKELVSNGDNRNNCETLIDTTIPIQKPVAEDDDHVCSVIEADTTSRKNEISISSELDDISRILNDDITLESFVKTGSVASSLSNLDTFKESLEAAVNECKRVKERSMKLKDDIKSYKSTIQNMEQENKKMSLDASRKAEEFCLMEKALKEAKEEIVVLNNINLASQNEKECLRTQLENNEKEGKTAEDNTKRLAESIIEVQKDKEKFELQIDKYEKSISQREKELETAMNSNNEYQKQIDKLKSELTSKIQTVVEQKELESAETHRDLQVVHHEKSELKRLHQDALTKLSQEIESKMKLQSLVNELQHHKLQAQSDLEDKDLESKFACEDMRKERAELKYRLNQSEKEVSTLKESYLTLKTKMEEKRSMLEEVQCQMSGLLSKINVMRDARISFFELLQNVGCCEELTAAWNPDDHNSDSQSSFESMIKEMNCWECIIPLIGNEFRELHFKVATIPTLKVEIDQLNSDLSKHKQTHDQKSQNEKLFRLLHQAEGEMERSTSQIKEMSEAMSMMQQREIEGNTKIQLMESELTTLKNESDAKEVERREELTKIKHLLLDASKALEQKDSQILGMDSEMNNLRSKIEEATILLRSKEYEEQSLKVNIQSYENKNVRLRDYIRKLTAKCEEWEASYERQSKAIDILQQKKARMKEKACEIADRYKALVTDVNRRKKLHQDDRSKWNNERSNLNSVHAALERELEQIAKELA